MITKLQHCQTLIHTLESVIKSLHAPTRIYYLFAQASCRAREGGQHALLIKVINKSHPSRFLRAQATVAVGAAAAAPAAVRLQLLLDSRPLRAAAPTAAAAAASRLPAPLLAGARGRLASACWASALLILLCLWLCVLLLPSITSRSDTLQSKKIPSSRLNYILSLHEMVLLYIEDPRSKCEIQTYGKNMPTLV